MVSSPLSVNLQVIHHEERHWEQICPSLAGASHSISRKLVIVWGFFVREGKQTLVHYQRSLLIIYRKVKPSLHTLPSVLLKALSKTIEDKNTLQIIAFYNLILLGNQAIKNRVSLKLQDKITKQNKSKSKNKTKTKNHPQVEVKTCWTNHFICLNKCGVTLSACRAVHLLFMWTGLTCSESRFQSFVLLFYF